MSIGWRSPRRVRSLPNAYGGWAVVAGASEGLGSAFAAQLAVRGMDLVLVARRPQLLAELKEQLIAEYGVEVRCVVLDLADPAFAEALADAVAGLDLGIVVYNAAFTPVGPFLEAPDEEISQAVDVNVRGPLLALRALVPGLVNRITAVLMGRLLPRKAAIRLIGRNTRHLT